MIHLFKKSGSSGDAPVSQFNFLDGSRSVTKLTYLSTSSVNKLDQWLNIVMKTIPDCCAKLNHKVFWCSAPTHSYNPPSSAYSDVRHCFAIRQNCSVGWPHVASLGCWEEAMPSSMSLLHMVTSNGLTLTTFILITCQLFRWLGGWPSLCHVELVSLFLIQPDAWFCFLVEFVLLPCIFFLFGTPPPN